MSNIPYGIIINIAKIDTEKEYILTNKNKKNSYPDKTDFPVFPGVEMVILEEVMLWLVSLALT